MPYSTNPTFTSGSVLSASALNTISGNLEFLHGVVSGANPAMSSIELTVDGDCYGVIRHMHNFLHVVYLCQNYFEVYYSADGATWTQVVDDGAPDGTVADSRIVDLSGYGFTVGGLYILKFHMDSGIVYYAYEKDTSGFL